jgi:hypothetical protein
MFADKREIGFVMRFRSPLLRLFLLSSDSAYLPEGPQKSECNDYE